MANQPPGLTGHCGCGQLRYELLEPPLFSHACHCIDCQRKAGSSFSITNIVVARDINVIRGNLRAEKLSQRSTAQCCEHCAEVIYVTSSAYPVTALLQTRTIDNPGLLEIGAHIWVKRKHAWLTLPEGIAQFEEDYQRELTWPEVSLQRLNALMNREV